MDAILLGITNNDQRKTELIRSLRSGTLDPDVVVQALQADTVSIVTAKPLMQALTNLADEDNCDISLSLAICNAIIKYAGRRPGAFSEEILRSREILADFYESDKQPLKALAELLSLPVDPGLRSGSDAYKAELYIRIADLSLDADNICQAELYVKKAWPLLKVVKDQNTINRFDTCQAKTYEIQRKFIDAAMKYNQLSHRLEDGIAALRLAIVCCVLAPAGPKRSRLLATMYRDERITQCGELGVILDKVHHQRVLREKDVAALRPLLQPYHQALCANGRTSFENAIIQHNLLSASKLYFNISVTELGNLLGVDPATAERIAGEMVAEDRLQATIDQVNEIILFTTDSNALVEEWDAQIDGVCSGICAVAEDIARRHPALRR